MACKGICLKYKFKKNPITKQVYSDGASRCQICEIFIRWDGNHCPCCGMKIRKVPRNKHGKETIKRIDETRVGRIDEKIEEPLIKVVR